MNPSQATFPRDPAFTDFFTPSGLLIRCIEERGGQACMMYYTNHGACMQKEGQQGLAHECEHNCFTPGENDVIDMIRKGTNLCIPNAETAFDHKSFTSSEMCNTPQAFKYMAQAMAHMADPGYVRSKMVRDGCVTQSAMSERLPVQCEANINDGFVFQPSHVSANAMMRACIQMSETHEMGRVHAAATCDVGCPEMPTVANINEFFDRTEASPYGFLVVVGDPQLVREHVVPAFSAVESISTPHPSVMQFKPNVRALLQSACVQRQYRQNLGGNMNLAVMSMLRGGPGTPDAHFLRTAARCLVTKTGLPGVCQEFNTCGAVLDVCSLEPESPGVVDIVLQLHPNATPQIVDAFCERAATAQYPAELIQQVQQDMLQETHAQRNGSPG